MSKIDKIHRHHYLVNIIFFKTYIKLGTVVLEILTSIVLQKLLLRRHNFLRHKEGCDIHVF
jgi:hypothetical protein